MGPRESTGGPAPGEMEYGDVENHTDFYMVVLVIELAAVALWELAKKAGTARLARLRAHGELPQPDPLAA